jgi:putative DNA methylase
MSDSRRLIEDYLPIAEISAESSREKSIRKGHISTLHLWWARRPLVACRAAVYGALIPAPHSAEERQEESRFVAALCKYPGKRELIEKAREKITLAHAERTGELGVPKVLDMFAGGGAIPLEALRLGCEAYAMDLNPVAHIIQLCTLVYPQKYGKPDGAEKGCSGDGTWAGLAKEVEHWGNRLLARVREQLSDVYPTIPDPFAKPEVDSNGNLWPEHAGKTASGRLVPTAYLWTRTVKCKNPACEAVVPLVRQTWLCKKPSRYVALKMVVPQGKKRVHFEVVEAPSSEGLGFDPTLGSEGGNATCPFCTTVADDTYVREQGMAKLVEAQLMAVVCVRPGERGKVYLAANHNDECVPKEVALKERLAALCERTGLTVPDEPINPIRPSPWTRGASGVTRHGLMKWGDLFITRQALCLLTYSAAVHGFEAEARDAGYSADQTKALATYLAVLVDRQADYNSTICRWHSGREVIGNTFGRQALPMVWDYCELAPFGDASGSPEGALEWIVRVIETQARSGSPATVLRGSAINLPWDTATFDAVVTDPPYYDNIPYADISDFFYVWLRRTIGHLYPEHFATPLTPKTAEATALSSRHGGDMQAATVEYESRMFQALAEAGRVLKPTGMLVIVYAHKATLGWVTLVDAIRRAEFTVTEAWPLDTEMGARLLAADNSALASSIFLVSRKRRGSERGLYEEQVRPTLEALVRERVSTLWDLGVSGADLVIACVGAGLSAFTRFATVEYANGQDVPAERFLAEVETVVLEAILERLSLDVGGEQSQYNLAGLDPATRFYVLWRYTYGAEELDAGEAIIFANGTHVELDGLDGLSSGSRPLLEKKKGAYRLKDFVQRGGDSALGVPSDDGQPSPLVDSLQRVLWLMEYHPSAIPDFLRDARPSTEQMRLVAQALAGPALKGGEFAKFSSENELAALAKLTANWRTVIEDSGFVRKEVRQSPQQVLPLTEDAR